MFDNIKDVDMMNFVALDLETATSVRSSICEIGITEVIDGVPQQPKSWLVQPENNEYDGMNIAVHGITPEDTKDSPLFTDVWKEVQPYLQNKIRLYPHQNHQYFHNEYLL